MATVVKVSTYCVPITCYMYHLCPVQVVRSADVSCLVTLGLGIKEESSIQNAYLKLIDDAKHFIYIEVFHKIVFKAVKIIAIKSHRTSTSFHLFHYHGWKVSCSMGNISIFNVNTDFVLKRLLIK